MNNLQIILKSIVEQEYKENTENYKDVASFFEFFSARLVLKNYAISDEEIESGIKGAGNDGGCDAIYLFCNGVLVKEDFIENTNVQRDSKLEFIVIQSKTSQSFSEDTLMKWKTVSKNLLDLNESVESHHQRYNLDVREAFAMLRETYTALVGKRVKLSFSYYYVSQGTELHPNVLEQGEELKKEVRTLFPASQCEINYYGAEQLIDICNEPIIRDYELKLADTPISLGNNKDYVALISLKEYFYFITNKTNVLNQSIFEANIRDYQGAVVVNKEIGNTLAENRTDEFWWLNNGITILAADISPISNKSLMVKDPEIVNGLQTSTEIFNYFSNNLEELEIDMRHVLARVIVPNNETSRDAIILATNNQTTIPKASLRASDAIHWQIEYYFKEKGIFYDRRKNYYKNQGKKRSEIISVSYLAQSLIAVLLQKPNYSRARPSTLLTNDEYYEELYSGNIEMHVYYKIIVWANCIRLYLRECNLYDSTTQGDLLFYVLYYAFSRHTGKLVMKAEDINKIHIEDLRQEVIADYTAYIYSIYAELGGTSKIAKSSQIIDRLMNQKDYY